MTQGGQKCPIWSYSNTCCDKDRMQSYLLLKETARNYSSSTSYVMVKRGWTEPISSFIPARIAHSQCSRIWLSWKHFWIKPASHVLVAWLQIRFRLAYCNYFRVITQFPDQNPTIDQRSRSRFSANTRKSMVDSYAAVALRKPCFSRALSGRAWGPQFRCPPGSFPSEFVKWCEHTWTRLLRWRGHFGVFSLYSKSTEREVVFHVFPE